MIDLLAPVGDFECLKAAVQNGANSVYFGANMFSARAFAHNFDLDELKKVIEYAKLRGVKTNLTLNTLVKDTEFNDALKLAIKAYEFGIDAIIVQDLGLAMQLIEMLPDLPIHASTQMSIHNLDGALELQKLGFKRVVLARELSMDEISNISKNTDIEIECFIHGALCISYSGQCLFSSMLGGRSGNRGKCAGPCRLSYDLLENNSKIDSGYLLSTKDLCGLEYIPDMIDAGVNCLKIEGRMKSPEYVATVTRIYRKYIDLALSDEPYVIDENDKKDLLQVFNRGMSSTGHLSDTPNKNLVYKDKPNHMGLFLGTVQNYNKNKGYVTLKLKESISIGDKVALENESGSYTISELMEKNKNIKETKINQTVTIGRIKGNINLGDKIYKISSKTLLDEAKESFKNENRTIPLTCNITIKHLLPVSINISSSKNNISEYKDLNVNIELPYIPEEAKNRPLDKETIIKQISKTNDTPYEFENININLDENIHLPKLSILNELRRTGLEKVKEYVLSKTKRNIPKNLLETNINDENKVLNDIRNLITDNKNISTIKNKEVSLLLNIINLSLDYSKLETVDNIYIPLKYFLNSKYENILKILSKKSNIFIYFPTILKENYKNLFNSVAKKIVQEYKIKGFVISNISNLKLLNDLFENLNKDFKLIANYTFNIFNSNSVLELKKLDISRFTISPEADKEIVSNLCKYNYLQKEIIVYGKTPLLNMNYCLLGNTNKCYPECKSKCNSNNIYYLKDRLNMNFEILPDNIQSITTMFNSKTTSIKSNDFNIDTSRIDILHESIDEINNIINTVKSNNRFEGKNFTNGNLNREL